MLSSFVLMWLDVTVSGCLRCETRGLAARRGLRGHHEALCNKFNAKLQSPKDMSLTFGRGTRAQIERLSYQHLWNPWTAPDASILLAIISFGSLFAAPPTP